MIWLLMLTVGVFGAYRIADKLSDDLNNKNFNKGFKDFLSKALPLTLITAILFIISLLILNNYYEINDAIIKVIFIQNVFYYFVL